MPIYRLGSKNVLFIHVPKTAGMAVGSHLSKAGPVVFEERIRTSNGFFAPRHQPAAVLETVFFPQMIDYAFMVVRHPVARLVSEYRYQRRRGLIQLSRLRVFKFNTWLRYAMHRLAKDPDWRYGHFRPQTLYSCFDCETFRYEDGLDRVMLRITEVSGLDIGATPRQTNVSPDRTVHISQSSLDLIADRYAADFERFGYQINVPLLKGVTGP